MHPHAACGEEAAERARERELRVLRSGVGAGGSEGDDPCDRHDVDDVRARLQPRVERTYEPDAAEVVRLQHGLDPLRFEAEEVSATGDARVVDQQVDGRVARQDRCGRPVDVTPVGDVAELVLAAELGGQSFQPLLPAGDQHAMPAVPRQLPRGLGADPADAPVTTATLMAPAAPTGRRVRRAGLRPSCPSRR